MGSIEWLSKVDLSVKMADINKQEWSNTLEQTASTRVNVIQYIQGYKPEVCLADMINSKNCCSLDEADDLETCIKEDIKLPEYFKNGSPEILNAACLSRTLV